MQKLKNIYTVT